MLRHEDQVFCAPVAQQPPSNQYRLFGEVSRSHRVKHTHTHTHKHKLDTHISHRAPLERNDQLIAGATTYTPHNEHKRRITMPSGGFEPAISAIGRPQIYALVMTATGMFKFILTEY